MAILSLKPKAPTKKSDVRGGTTEKVSSGSMSPGEKVALEVEASRGPGSSSTAVDPTKPPAPVGEGGDEYEAAALLEPGEVPADVIARAGAAAADNTKRKREYV